MQSIAVINVHNHKKKVAMNKDLNGGFGTADTYSNSIFEKILAIIKRKSVKLPVTGLANLMGIFREKGITSRYYENKLPIKTFDIYLIYGSIVDFRNENRVAKIIKKHFPNSQVGFIGPFPSTMPKYFKDNDFVIKGDYEKFFLEEYDYMTKLHGVIEVKGNVNMDLLPPPELNGFPIKNYGYSPAIVDKPFFALQASKGCPYSCSYYCVYGKFQGPIVNVRSPSKVVEDILYLKKKHGIKGIQFRDPTFGIKPGYIEELCKLMREKRTNVKWGIETKIGLLDKNKIRAMFKVGLRNINIGVETIDPKVAKKNRRIMNNMKHQEDLIKYCEKIGVKVSAFYLFGYDGDTKKSMRTTLNYAKKLNTFIARFAVCTPYPGTEFYEEMKKQDRLLTDDLEQYTQFNLVLKHKNLKPNDVSKMLSKAYKEYYFRPKFIFKVLIWKIREFWL
jgi:anaerobic magnesium-protoporphyrin IX monomethyl ester cyclase